MVAGVGRSAGRLLVHGRGCKLMCKTNHVVTITTAAVTAVMIAGWNLRGSGSISLANAAVARQGVARGTWR